MMKYFEEMSLTRKIIVGFLVLSTTASLIDGSFFGALITGAVAYYLIITSGLKDSDLPQSSESDDEYYERQRQDDDAYTMQKKEEERIEEENRINQKAFDGTL